MFANSEQRQLLEKDLDQILTTYEEVMRKRRKREDQIEDAYALISDRKAIGDYPGAADLCSEMLMSTVDQADARVISKILSVEPIMSVEPTDSWVFRDQQMKSPPIELAAALQRFLASYGDKKIKVKNKLPKVVHRADKVGTAVLHISWAKQTKPVVQPSAMGSEQVMGLPDDGVKWRLIANRDVMVWPAWSHDWQEDYEWVGHRTYLTVSKFKVWAQEQGFTPEEIEELVLRAVSPSDAKMKSAEAQGYQTAQADSSKLTGLVPIWEIWGYRPIADVPFPTSFYLFYSQETKKAYKPRLNPNRNGKHPYFPVRYKLIDQSAWGNGIGHEVYTAHVADTAYRNLEIDNLMASVFSLVLTKMDSTADSQSERPYPGMRIATEDPATDMNVVSFAESGPVEMLYRGMEQNDRRKMNATGLAAVLSGQGDPTMKSGAGTGSTIALIEQASTKFGRVDETIRADLSPIYAMTAELCCQFGGEDIFQRYVAPEDAALLEQLRQVPPGESIESMFQMKVAASSATVNKELQKNNALAIWHFTQEAFTATSPVAQQVLTQMNPGAMVGYMVQWLNIMSHVGQQVIDLNDLPGLKKIMPEIPMEPTPEQQQIATLQQQMQSLQVELDQALAEGGETAGGGATQTVPEPGA